MNDDGDTPTVADLEAVQSTPMASLNDEIAPRTENKKTMFQRVGSFIGRKKSKADESEEDVVAQLKIALLASEAEKKELIKEMDCEAKLKSAVIEQLNIANVTLEAEKKVLITKMDYEAKLNSARIEHEATLKTKEMESLKKESDILSEKLQASRNEIDRYKNELDSNASRMTEMYDELKSKLTEIENLKIAHQQFEAEKEVLITKIDSEAKLKSAEIENLKATQAKAEVEWKSIIDKMESEVNSKAKEIEYRQKIEAELKSAMTRMESEIKSKSEEIDSLKRKSEDETASSKLESDRLNEKLEAIRDEFDRYKRDFDAKKTEMDIEINSKAKEIECLQKMESEWKSRISQLEDEVKAANCKVEENLKVSGDVQRILEKVETNSSGLSNIPSQTSYSDACTIRARFTNISSLTFNGEYSKWTEFAGVNWRISVRNFGGSLAIYFYGEKSVHGWSGYMKAEFKLLSQHDQSIVKSLEVNDDLWDGWLYCGSYEFIPFEEMLRGNAVRDDSIIVEVVARVFPSN